MFCVDKIHSTRFDWEISIKIKHSFNSYICTCMYIYLTKQLMLNCNIRNNTISLYLNFLNVTVRKENIFLQVSVCLLLVNIPGVLFVVNCYSTSIRNWKTILVKILPRVWFCRRKTSQWNVHASVISTPGMSLIHYATTRLKCGWKGPDISRTRLPMPPCMMRGYSTTDKILTNRATCLPCRF